MSELAFKNDLFRAFGPSASIPGRCVMTRGVGALPNREEIVEAVRGFSSLSFEDDSPEHDFGVVEAGGTKLFFKIDYYEDERCQFGAENPEVKCYRVLTVLLPEEY